MVCICFLTNFLGIKHIKDAIPAIIRLSMFALTESTPLLSKAINPNIIEAVTAALIRFIFLIFDVFFLVNSLESPIA
jgi:hypothetical protein